MKLVVNNSEDTASIHAKIIMNLTENDGKAVNPFHAIRGIDSVATSEALRALNDLVAAGIVEKQIVTMPGISGAMESVDLPLYRYPLERKFIREFQRTALRSVS